MPPLPVLDAVLPRLRRWRVGIAAVITCVLSGCGGAGGADPQAAPMAPGTWVVLGSSTAAGAGATAGQGWVARLAEQERLRGVHILNFAKGGLTTYAALPTGTAVPAGRPLPDPEANVTAALSHRPHWVLVAFPNNDTALGYAAEETVANLLRIRAAAREQGVGVLVLSSQPRNMPADRRARLAQIDQQLSANAGPCFVAVHNLLATSDGLLHPLYDAGDGVHLNNAGHAVVLQQVRAVIDGGGCRR